MMIVTMVMMMVMMMMITGSISTWSSGRTIKVDYYSTQVGGMNKMNKMKVRTQKTHCTAVNPGNQV